MWPKQPFGDEPKLRLYGPQSISVLNMERLKIFILSRFRTLNRILLHLETLDIKPLNGWRYLPPW